MAADKPLKLQILRLPSRERHIIPSIPSTTPLATLQQHIQTLLTLPTASQLLYNGFPPKELDLSDPQRTLADCGIRNGDTVEVRVREVEGGGGAVVEEVRQGKGWEYPPTVEKGVMQRKQMPSDNSCLFHSIAYVCNNRATPSPASAAAVRETVANVVASDPAKYSTIFLGSPNALYQQHIMSPDTWGGAIELSILATHYQTEIVAFDHKHLREDVFGRGEGYKRRVFVLYTGDHYDALVWQAGVGGGGGEQVVFSVRDDSAWLHARSYVSSLHGEGARRGEWSLQNDWRSGEGLVRKDDRRAEKERQKKASAMKEERKRDEEKTAANLRKASADSAPQQTAGGSGAKTERKDGEGEGDDVVEEKWKCRECTLYNSMSAMTCGACGAPSPHINEDYFSKPPPSYSSPSSSSPASSSKSKSKDKRSNGKSSSSSSTSSSSGGTRVVLPNTTTATSTTTPSDTFICNFCTFHNPPTRARCEMCSEPNPNLPPSALTSDPLMSDVDEDGVRAPIPQQEEQLIGGADMLFPPVGGGGGRPRLGSHQPTPPPVLDEEMLALEWTVSTQQPINLSQTLHRGRR